MRRLTLKTDALTAKVNLHADGTSRVEGAIFKHVSTILYNTWQICRAMNQPCGNQGPP